MNPVQLHPSAQDEHGVMPPQSYYYFYGSGDSPLTTANRFGEHNTCLPTATPSTMAAIQRAPTSSFFFNDVPIEEHETDGFDQYPSLADFEAIVQGYLRNLSPKKRDKALVDRKRYSLIARVLKDPRNTSISTAQFRFWVKKMFQLVPGQNDLDIVCHDNKPVAMREQIYMILVRAHKEANHGGRDKTSALVRRRYSWIPKELIARFVRHCPFCMSRRNGCQSPPMGLLPRTPPEYLATAPVGDHHSNEQQAAMMAAPLTSTATGVEDNGLLFMNDESWHACFRSADSGQLPVNYTASPPPPPSAPERQPGPPAFIHQQQQHQFHDSEQQQQQQQSRPSLPGLGMTGYAQNEPITTTAAAATFEMCYRDFSQPPPQQQQFSAPLAQPQPIYVHTNRSIKTGDFRTKAIFPYDLSAPSPSSSFSSSSSFSTSASSVVSSPVTQTPTSMDQQHAIFPPTTQWYSISHTNNGALGPQQHPQQRFF